jgi:hypothetical protein
MKKIYLLFLALFAVSFSFGQGTISVGILGNANPTTPAFPSGTNNFDGPDLNLENAGDDINFFLADVTLQASLEGLKFRTNDDWATNWGNDPFPYGQGFLNGANIDTQAGTFDIYFRIDSATGNAVFSFQTPGTFPSVGILGDALPNNGFGGPDLNLATIDGIIYTANEVTMVSGDFKLRQNGDWNVNWGVLPTNPMASDGAGTFTASTNNDFGNTVNINIDVTGPSVMFDITFNRHTNELTLVDSTLSLGDLTQSGVQARFVGNELVVSGLNDLATISGFDLLGRKLFSVQRNLSGNFRESLPMPENQIGILRIESPTFTKTLKVATIR